MKNKILTEKYRPEKFEDLIMENKSTVINSLKNKESIPSFIFHSESPGTGKTTCAKVIIKYLDCDFLMINSSMDRGIDLIREQVSLFSRTLGMNDVKKCVFLDEADGILRASQDSMKNLLETYSHNVFFIMSCNHVEKLIEPIRSRCVSINFDKPPKETILERLQYVSQNEELDLKESELKILLDNCYPDIRSMIIKLQLYKVDKTPVTTKESEFTEFFEYVKLKDVPQLYEIVYSGTFDIRSFNKWLWHYIFINYNKIGLEKAAKIALLLADTEKAWNLDATKEIIFLSNIIEISKTL